MGKLGDKDWWLGKTDEQQEVRAERQAKMQGRIDSLNAKVEGFRQKADALQSPMPQVVDPPASNGQPLDRKQRKAEATFASSPQGLARQAHEAGDHIFQISLPLIDQRAVAVGLIGAQARGRSGDPNAHLNAILGEGWRLMSVATAFVETGQQSRDKLMKSGQDVATSGQLVGTYVFERVG